MKMQFTIWRLASLCICVFFSLGIGQAYANANNILSRGSGDFDMQSDFTYVSGDLGYTGSWVSGSLTFTPVYEFSDGIAAYVASFTDENLIPNSTKNFYSGSWLITITPSAERRIMVTWTGGGIAPSGNITINISYQL